EFLLLPVSFIVVSMKRLKPHERAITNNNGTVRLRQADGEFAGHAFWLFPFQSVISKNSVPRQIFQFSECFDGFLDL
ncbi:MAG: hypothetical protein JZU64_08610, partial [Rhodoferax sp.]|nr:hypothetical protein [Rhodoferax sp.]